MGFRALGQEGSFHLSLTGGSPWDGCADLGVTSKPKGTGSDWGIHTSTQGGKVKLYLELPGWLKTKKKKKEFEFGNISEMEK